MSSVLTMLERKNPNNLNSLYLLNRPVYKIQPDHRLTLAKEYATAGNVTAIQRDDQERYHVKFAQRNELVITAKKVVNCTTAAITPSCHAFLQSFGFHLPTNEPLGTKGPLDHPEVLLPITLLTTMPTHYVVVDCEFGNLFRRTSASNTINWQVYKFLGLKTNVFQLSAISFNAHRQSTIFFNRYFDNPNFLPEKKLTGLAETGLTLAEYERQGAPLAIIKAFTNQVLQAQLPLVFWDQTQDVKYLRRVIAAHYAELTPTEQKIVTTPVSIFDAQAFTNTIINHGNHKSGYHDLPLNGLAALFNLTNSHQHNAIWDVQTTEAVMRKMDHLYQQPPVQTVQPAPIYTPTPQTPLPTRDKQQNRHAKYALVHKLHARGKTYREIAAVTGISISGVNYILKKAVATSSANGVTPGLESV
ncbi:hypothetical protein D1831_00800 [Lactiplantibacillus garii]|uniref:Uncharacterized protein n=1 Tax=Lactiplantibacillus garii TaxID=2306423 RepID=A0A3R8LLV4_9LACO|nr:hypothetical protein [Lactiplantibacillus garii]RRK11646.1 hypothetical protein D1831_00800 [Lactiplantibacillus garii]